MISNLCPLWVEYIGHILDLKAYFNKSPRFCLNCDLPIWGICQCGESIRFDEKICDKCEKENEIYWKNNPAIIVKHLLT